MATRKKKKKVHDALSHLRITGKKNIINQNQVGQPLANQNIHVVVTQCIQTSTNVLLKFKPTMIGERGDKIYFFKNATK